MLGFIHDELETAGHEVDYFCADDVPERLRGRIARLAFPALVLRKAIDAARAGRPYDIVNVHEPSSAAMAAGKALAGGPRVVVTSHGLERRAWQVALDEGRLGRGGPTRKTRVLYPATSLWQSTLGLRCADHIFCLNFEDRDCLQEWLGLGAERVTRIYPAADKAFGEAGKGRDYAGATKILFAGTWRQNKGIDDLVPAFTQLAGRYPEVELHVLGAGAPPEVVLQSFPADVRDRVRCSVARSDEAFAAAYASAHIFVQPSLFEGTPQTLLEAMASGLPLVTTATCGMRDVIDDGRNGLLIPIRAPNALAAAIERLLADPALRARLGAAARAQALERYVWTVVAAPVREVYERIVRERPGAQTARAQ